MFMREEDIEKLDNFIEEAKRLSLIDSEQSDIKIKTQILRFQSEVNQFLDHTINDLEINNSNKPSRLYFLRPRYKENLADYMKRQQKQYPSLLPATFLLLKAFHKDIRRNNYAVSLIYPKAKHEKLHSIDKTTDITFDIKNISRVPTDEFIKSQPDGSTDIGTFIKLAPGATANVQNSVFTDNNGVVIVNDLQIKQKFNGTIIFTDPVAVKRDYRIWAKECISTCESIKNRIK
jgi:hypothetical protein